MENLDKESMKMIVGGGVSITGSLVSAFGDLIKVIYGIGQAVGGAIRRIQSGSLCKY